MSDELNMPDAFLQKIEEITVNFAELLGREAVKHDVQDMGTAYLYGFTRIVGASVTSTEDLIEFSETWTEMLKDMKEDGELEDFVSSEEHLGKQRKMAKEKLGDSPDYIR